MTFAAQRFLAVARELVEPREHTAPQDARERAAIGRAYYAVFGRALSLFTGFGEYTASRRGDDHEGLASKLAGSREHRRTKVSQVLDRLRLSRRWADYERALEPTRRDTVRLASVAITQATHALTLLDDIERAP